MSAQLPSDVAVALRLLKDGRTDPDRWTTSDRQAVTRLHVWRDAELANAQEADRQAVPGVYSADQGTADREQLRARDAVEAAMRDHDASMEDRLARLRHVRTQRDAALADKRRLADQLAALEARLASEQRAHDRLAQVCDEQGAQLRDLEGRLANANVALQSMDQDRTHLRTLEGALDVLGITRGQLDTGQAVELAGHVYVRRDLLVAHVQDDLDRAAQPQPFAGGESELVGAGTYTSELLEARGGVFVPIPEGHMLSVTVTPYAAD